ncbi:MAG: hypothetical protein DWP95_00495 [Proteobacteria bacterium]|nr:MAG: hypothetical protein DWP95_00495 [Pseudomonadota bacterium]
MKKLCFICLLVSFNVLAAPVRFDFVFDDPNSTARTEGYIIFEETLLSNPVDEIISLPSPKVLDLQLTVTGSIYSDGIYNLNDYDEIDFWSNGGTLDFSQPLIGQPTNGQPWGTTFDGNSGEFNFYAFGQGGPQKSSKRHNPNRAGLPLSGPPQSCDWFTICEFNGQVPTGTNTKGLPIQSPMALQSMQPNRGTPVQSVPTLTVWSTVTLGLVFLVMAGLFRRRLS